MSVERCVGLVRTALDKVIEQVNAGNFADFNEATIQHHLALNLHLDALMANGHDLDVRLEKKVRRHAPDLFPKTNKGVANIDIFFIHPDDGSRCAIELKCFHRDNHREPNNRCDVFLDLANLEVYLAEHADVGLFILLTDHKHYFDNRLAELGPAASGFNTRQDHTYEAGTVLTYEGTGPYNGKTVTLNNSYSFHWSNALQDARMLVLEVRP